MVNGEICIGLFALRDIKQVCILPPLTTFMCVVNSTRFCSFVLYNIVASMFQIVWPWKFEQLTSISFLVCKSLCIMIIKHMGKCESLYKLLHFKYENGWLCRLSARWNIKYLVIWARNILIEQMVGWLMVFLRTWGSYFHTLSFGLWD